MSDDFSLLIARPINASIILCSFQTKSRISCSFVILQFTIQTSENRPHATFRYHLKALIFIIFVELFIQFVKKTCVNKKLAIFTMDLSIKLKVSNWLSESLRFIFPKIKTLILAVKCLSLWKSSIKVSFYFETGSKYLLSWKNPNWLFFKLFIFLNFLDPENLEKFPFFGCFTT